MSDRPPTPSVPPVDFQRVVLERLERVQEGLSGIREDLVRLGDPEALRHGLVRLTVLEQHVRREDERIVERQALMSERLAKAEAAIEAQLAINAGAAVRWTLGGKLGAALLGCVASGLLTAIVWIVSTVVSRGG